MIDCRMDGEMYSLSRSLTFNKAPDSFDGPINKYIFIICWNFRLKWKIFLEGYLLITFPFITLLRLSLVVDGK